MTVDYDPTKNERNIALRGLSFEETKRFDWDGAVVIEDTRRAYSEPRYQALGLIDGRLHVLVFTIRNEALRVISLRKANAREVACYEKTKP